MTVQGTEIARCLSSIREHSPLWLVDLPKHLDRHLVNLLDVCDQIVFIVEPTLACVNAAKRWQRVFADLGYGGDKVVGVINRAGGRLRLVEDEVSKVKQLADFLRLPDAFDLIEVSHARGETAVVAQAKTAYAVAMKKLAGHLLERLNDG